MADPQKETLEAREAREKAERERLERERIMTTATMDAAAARTTTTTKEMARTKPVAGTVVPPGTETVRPMKPYGTVDERTRMHAKDPSVHPDWETQPQINAPEDVGIPTPEGQADAARIRAGRRRSDEAKEPRLERRGDEVTVPPASSAQPGGVTGAVKETARDVKEKTKETAADVKEDVERKI